MRSAAVFGCLAIMTLGLLPAMAQEQAVTMTGSPLPDQPFTLIHPSAMIVSGNPGEPVVITHPTIPLQCVLRIVPVADTGWTAEQALADLNDADVAQSWAETVPGFAITAKSTVQVQGVAALRYDGTGTATENSPPVTVVHTETVDSGNGYTLDCMYGTPVEAEARPIVDYIVTNFSTKQDAQPISTLQ